MGGGVALGGDCGGGGIIIIIVVIAVTFYCKCGDLISKLNGDARSNFFKELRKLHS
jgi:hypothetical protein